MHDLTGFQRNLLYAIAEEEQPHELALKDKLEDYYEQEIHPELPTSTPWSRRISATSG